MISRDRKNGHTPSYLRGETSYPGRLAHEANGDPSFLKTDYISARESKPTVDAVSSAVEAAVKAVSHVDEACFVAGIEIDGNFTNDVIAWLRDVKDTSRA